jgi:hypothetical protein
MRTTLAHDSFTQLGGAERVATHLHEIYPQSPLYTLVVDKAVAGTFASWDIKPSLLQNKF